MEKYRHLLNFRLKNTPEMSETNAFVPHRHIETWTRQSQCILFLLIVMKRIWKRELKKESILNGNLKL